MKLGLPRRARTAAILLTAAASAFGTAAAVPTVASGADTAPDPAADAAELDQLVVVETDLGAPGTNNFKPVSLVTVNADGTPSTKPVIPLPSEARGGNHALTLNTGEYVAGQLARSVDGRYLTLTGWTREPGGAGSDAFSVGRVDAEGTVDTTTTVGDSFRNELAYGAVTVDGETFFVGGDGKDGSSNSAIVRVPFGGNQGVSWVNSLMRTGSTPRIIDGQLYVASTWVSPYGIAKIGTGIPSAPAPYTAAFGSNWSGTNCCVGSYTILDLNPAVPGGDTAYIANRGIKKLSFDGTGWAVASDLGGGNNIDALTARVVDGKAEIFFVRGNSAGNQVVRVVDAAASAEPAAFAEERLLKTADSTKAFRGPDFAPDAWDPAPPPPPPASEIAVVEINGTANTSSSVAIQRYAVQNNAWRGQLQLPATAVGSAPAVTLPGSQVGVGSLRRSADGRYVTLLGTTNPVGPRAAAPSVVARFDDQAAVDLSTVVTDSFQTVSSQPLEVISTDGSAYWMSGQGGGAGTRYVPHGGGQPSTQVVSYQFPSLSILDGTLYGGGNPFGNGDVNRFQDALPTSGPQTWVPLGLTAQEFGEDFALLDLDDTIPGPDTAYLAASYQPQAGLIKMAIEDGTWTRQGTIATPATLAHLTAQEVLGGVELYGTTTDGRQLLKFVDTADRVDAPAVAPVVTIATANPGTVFRGVAFPPNGAWPATVPTQPSARPSLQLTSTSVVGTALNPRNPTLGVNIADRDTPAANLTVTVTSTNQNVLPAANVTIEGTTAYRRLSFAPIAQGSANVTVTVTDPQGNATSATFNYTAKRAVEDTSIFFYHGVDDISSALDVGDGYILAVSDETNDPFLYRRQRATDVVVPGSSASKTFNVIGGSEYDYEGMARVGDLIYLFASHGNDKGGGSEPGRARFDVVRATGTGLNLQLEHVGGSTELKPQLHEWDASNGHGLGANALGFVEGSRPGVIPNPPNGFNIEGVEFAPESSSTIYLAWRAPTVVRDGKPHALIVPVTNIDTFSTGEDEQAEFGDPIFLDLGGRSIRDIRKNADERYLISAGPGNDATSWALYTWDGNPDHAPVLDQILPDENVAGTWETIPSVPTPIVAGAQVELLTDAGDTDGQSRSFGKVFTLTGGPRAGYLKVDVLPRGTGAKVTVDGVVRDAGGLDELALPAGEHEVCVQATAGYAAPPCETVTIDAETGSHVSLNLRQLVRLYVVWNYSRINSAQVTVTVDGVPVGDSTNGEVLFDVTPGEPHRICWSAVAGFNPPACQVQTFTGPHGYQVFGTYTVNPDAQGYNGPSGMLRVVQTANPLASTVVVDGKPRAVWGLDWMRITPGQREVCFTEVAGWITPECQTVTVSPNRTTTVEMAFTPAATLRVGANVPAAQIFVDGVATDGWGVWTHLPAGEVEVSFGDVPGYTTPAPRTVTLTAGELTDVTGEYAPIP